ncbi:hypothetical protein FNH22_06690 [Fulvivirga sp. M361]|nr:hypothetical protein FNH22_06690 [Fulvivirga sp. M361]
MLRKNRSILLLGLFLFTGTLSSAQEEQVKDSTIVDKSWRSSYSYLNIADYEMKIMFKIMQPRYNMYNGIVGGNLSIESKLSPSISLETGYIVPSHDFHTVFGRLRYYTKKSKGSGGVNNFIGSHFLVGVDKFFERRNDYNIVYRSIYPNDLQFNLGYGYQGKVGRYGYYNVLAVVNYGVDRKTAYGLLRVDAGFGYGIARKSKNASAVTEPLPFIHTKRGLFKASNIGFALGEEHKGAGIELAYERSVWGDMTIEGSLFGAFGEYNYTLEGVDQKVRYDWIVADVNLRYYYNRKKRLSRGKIDRDFCGPYLLMGVSESLGSRDPTRFIMISPYYGDSFSGQPIYRMGWGYQQQIGKHAFIDFNLGPSYNTNTGFEAFSNLKIGLSF